MCGGVYWSRRGHGPLPSPVYLYSQVLLILFFLNGWGEGRGKVGKEVRYVRKYYCSNKNLYFILNSSENPYLRTSSKYSDGVIALHPNNVTRDNIVIKIILYI